MAKENSNKVKLLKLIELLRQESDEQHPMRGSIVCQRLSEINISCDRRTFTRDIAALNEYGYEVMATMVSHEKAYYVADRSFSVPELKILIDAVQAASFITDKKTADLTYHMDMFSLAGKQRGIGLEVDCTDEAVCLKFLSALVVLNDNRLHPFCKRSLHVF